MGTGNDEYQWNEMVKPWKVARLLDSNGTEAAVTTVVGLKQQGDTKPLDEFLATITRTGDRKDRLSIKDFREAYTAFCESKGILPEPPAKLGRMMAQRDIESLKSNGYRILLAIRYITPNWKMSQMHNATNIPRNAYCIRENILCLTLNSYYSGDDQR